MSSDNFMMVTLDKDQRRQLTNMLGKLEPRIRGQVLRRALRKGSRLMVLSARSKAPKKTGKGRKHIRARNLRNPNRYMARVGVGVHPDAFYMRFFETGYFAVGSKTREIIRRQVKGRTRRARSVRGRRVYDEGTAWIPPRPFLRPALHEQKDEAVKAAGKHLWDQLTKGMPRR